MIEARGVSVRPGGVPVLERVSCALHPGEIVCILGPNGAGKSTLLRTMAGGVIPDEGQITLDGKNLADWPARDLARRRAVLNQILEMAFPFTAQDIVTMGRSPHEDRAGGDITRRALEAADAAALAGRVYTTLSGGEKQRVQIARALTQIGFTAADLNGKYLFLDEPISALDLRHQKSLAALLMALKDKGAGILCVVHDINYACAVADRMVMMKGGRVVAVRDSLSAGDLSAVYDIEAREVSEAGRRVFVTV